MPMLTHEQELITFRTVGDIPCILMPDWDFRHTGNGHSINTYYECATHALVKHPAISAKTDRGLENQNRACGLGRQLFSL